VEQLDTSQADGALRSFMDPTISVKLWIQVGRQRWDALLDILEPKMTSSADRVPYARSPPPANWLAIPISFDWLRRPRRGGDPLLSGRYRVGDGESPYPEQDCGASSKIALVAESSPAQ
jgi:hypothetical protein